MAKTKEDVVQEFRIESIQDAALRVIARKGTAGASMQEIADEAHVAKGTIYLYFQNQQDLLDKTVDRAISQLLVKTEAILDSDAPLRKVLTNLLEAEIAFFDEHREFFRFYATAAGGELDAKSGRCDRAGRPQYHSHLERFTRFLESRRDKGEIRDCDCRRAAIFFEEGAIGVVLHRMTEPEHRPLSEEAEWLVSMFLDGISKQKKRSRA